MLLSLPSGTGVAPPVSCAEHRVADLDAVLGSAGPGRASLRQGRRARQGLMRRRLPSR